jgi:hypothetical protein
VIHEGGSIGREGGGELLVEQAGLGDEFGVTEVLPSAEGEVDLGSIALAAVFFKPVGEGLAELMAEVFELLFLACFGLGVAGGGSLLTGDKPGERMDHGAEFGGAGGESGRSLVFPSGLVAGIFQQLEEREMHVLAVGVFVLHDVGFVFVSGEKGEGAVAGTEMVVAMTEAVVAITEMVVAEAEAVVSEAEAVVAEADVVVAETEAVVAGAEGVVAKTEALAGMA